MSAAFPDCPVCLSPWHREAEKLIKQGTSFPLLAQTFRTRRAAAVKKGRMKSEDVTELTYEMLEEHVRRCAKKAVAVMPAYVGAEDIETPGGRAIPISVSAAEMADPTKRLDVLREALAARIGELSAKDLYAMYMAELKLQTAQAERAAKGGPSAPLGDDDTGSDALDSAMAQAAGHLPDLRVVSRRERRPAS